jgi:hypothetical protein
MTDPAPRQLQPQRPAGDGLAFLVPSETLRLLARANNERYSECLSRSA